MADKSIGFGSSIVTEDRHSSSMVTGSSEIDYEASGNLTGSNSEINMLIKEKKQAAKLTTDAIIKEEASEDRICTVRSMDQQVNLSGQKKDGASQKSKEIPTISNENDKVNAGRAQDLEFQTTRQTMAAGSGKSNDKVSTDNNKHPPIIAQIKYLKINCYNKQSGCIYLCTYTLS